MGRMGRQVKIVAAPERHGLSLDLEFRLSLEKADPLVPVLVVELGLGPVAAHDALDSCASDTQEFIEHLARPRFGKWREEIPQRGEWGSVCVHRTPVW